jgi:REP element-mobilizing transposase RayT
MSQRWPDRQTVRLPEHNYGARAGYFVTLCTAERACIFGEIHDGALSLSETGTIVGEEWRRTADLRPNVVLDAFVVMPNHVHGILFLARPSVQVDRQALTDGLPSSQEVQRASQRLAPTMPSRAGSLGTIVGQFKSAVTKRVSALAGEPVVIWQRNYHEHIIRDRADLDRIRRYISENPARWPEDPENPVNQPPHHPSP